MFCIKNLSSKEQFYWPGIGFHELLKLQLPIIILVNCLRSVKIIKSLSGIANNIQMYSLACKHNVSRHINLIRHFCFEAVVKICFSHFENLFSPLSRARNGLWIPILVITDHSFWDFHNNSIFCGSPLQRSFYPSTWFDPFDAVESFDDDDHLLHVDHAVVVHVVQPESPPQLLLIYLKTD